MLELDLIDVVAGRMAMDMYTELRNDHSDAMTNDLLTEAGADEAARMAIEKLYHAMKELLEVDDEV